MFTIHQGQMGALGQSARRLFEEEMLAHWRTLSPGACELIGGESLRRAIHLGIDRAHVRGFSFRGPVRLYLELMLMHGSFFDTDPQHPWAAQLSNADARDPQTLRAKRLHRHALDYQRLTMGADGRLLVRALDETRRILLEREDLPGDDIAHALLQLLARVNPQRCEALGVDCLMITIRCAAEQARTWGLLSVRGIVLFLALHLTVGHECVRDPLVPWVEAALLASRDTALETREHRLEASLLSWIDQCLAVLAKEAAS